MALLRLGSLPVCNSFGRCLRPGGHRETGCRRLGSTVGSAGWISHGRNGIRGFGDACSLLFSASSGRSCPIESIGVRNCKIAVARKRGTLSRVFCSGSPEAQEPNRESPWLQWAILATLVAAAGGALFLISRGGKLLNAGGGGRVLQFSSEGPAKFTVNLPVLGVLSLGEVTPGWVYFLLLMAAGFGLFVSEEALNVWVGASLGRLLTYGSREAFLDSLTANWPYIVATILWVYWGVCISDMVPFYAGKFASGQGDRLGQKIGVSKEKYEQVTSRIQRYGNLIGFVERFSLGIRNPTSFLAGVAGVSPEKFFAGVCVGALLTLPIQMSIGFALRERPLAALTGVATVVGAWTVFPYATAGMVYTYYLLRRRTGSTS